jgi:23S rRNA (cytosine1962-C5)-methyltransferase
MTDLDSLSAFLTNALARRAPLIEHLTAHNTDCYRLFHGAQEGAPGITLDRYGDLALLQTFHAPVSPDAPEAIAGILDAVLPGLDVVYNDRSAHRSKIANRLDNAQLAAAQRERVATEFGVRYRICARHRGNDPWLFLDLRPTRLAMAREAEGKSLLNLFAYTCGAGVAAAVAGATRVVNVDFAASSLATGTTNAALNEVSPRTVQVESDVFPALRQLAGTPQPSMLRGRRLPAFPHLNREQFDLVFLDPPPRAKSRFGVVDVANDYQSMLKPSLSVVAEGGAIYCTNNSAAVDEKDWHDVLRRCAEKHGRPVRSLDVIRPGGDFPSSDDRPPLKVARLEL